MHEKSKSPLFRTLAPSGLGALCLVACLFWFCLVLLANPGRASGLGDTTPNHPLGSDSAGQERLDLNLSLNPHDYFSPPNDGERHRILVIDRELGGFITTTERVPRGILAQTHYVLGARDWTIWGRPLQTKFGNFYVLLIIRDHATTQSGGQTYRIPQPTLGSTGRRSNEIELNLLVYRQLVENGYAMSYGWNVHVQPKHSLQNVVVVEPPPITYQPTTEVSDGQTIIKDPGRVRVVREFRVLTDIDGIAVDQQAVVSQVINYAQSRVVAIGVRYNNGHIVPDWQRPLLIKMAGIDPDDWEYVNYIIYQESRWKPRAKNKLSGAYGLCQALPAGKMSSAGKDYQSNAITQLRWCHDYAQVRYGNWEQAYRFWVQNHWW